MLKPMDGEYAVNAYTGIIIEFMKSEHVRFPDKVIVFDKTHTQYVEYAVQSLGSGEWLYGIPLLLGAELQFATSYGDTPNIFGPVMYKGVHIANNRNGYLLFHSEYPSMLFRDITPPLVTPIIERPAYRRPLELDE